MCELVDIAGGYKTRHSHMIVEKYKDIENNEIIYILYINNSSQEDNVIGSEDSGSDDSDNIIEYKWYENDSTDINNLLINLKTIGGSYYDENNEVLYGPDIRNISRDISYEITSYEKGFRNKYHELCFDEIPLADKNLSLILNEIYGTVII